MNKDYNIDNSNLLEMLEEYGIPLINERGEYRKINNLIEHVRRLFVKCVSFSDSVAFARIEQELIYLSEIGIETAKGLVESSGFGDCTSESLDSFLKGFTIREAK